MSDPFLAATLTRGLISSICPFFAREWRELCRTKSTMKSSISTGAAAPKPASSAWKSFTFNS